jgi:hypothetical protein
LHLVLDVRVILFLTSDLSFPSVSLDFCSKFSPAARFCLILVVTAQVKPFVAMQRFFLPPGARGVTALCFLRGFCLSVVPQVPLGLCSSVFFGGAALVQPNHFCAV